MGSFCILLSDPLKLLWLRLLRQAIKHCVYLSTRTIYLCIAKISKYSELNRAPENLEVPGLVPKRDYKHVNGFGRIRGNHNSGWNRHQDFAFLKRDTEGNVSNRHVQRQPLP